MTDKNGNYKIDLNDKAEFVYLLTPKGYVADFSTGVPQFFQPVEQSKKQYDFSLKKMQGDSDKFVMITMADTQLDTEADVKRLFSETLPDIKETVSQCPGVQAAGIVLGDISWDVYIHNASYKEFAKQLGFPVYPVIGNHDFDKYMSVAQVQITHIFIKRSLVRYIMPYS